MYVYMYIHVYLSSTVGHLFSRATNFANRAKKGVHGNYFHKTTLAALLTIHVQLTCDGVSVNFQ